LKNIQLSKNLLKKKNHRKKSNSRNLFRTVWKHNIIVCILHCAAPASSKNKKILNPILHFSHNVHSVYIGSYYVIMFSRRNDAYEQFICNPVTGVCLKWHFTPRGCTFLSLHSYTVTPDINSGKYCTNINVRYLETRGENLQSKKTIISNFFYKAFRFFSNHIVYLRAG